jgi:hypothetical protein
VLHGERRVQGPFGMILIVPPAASISVAIAV